VLLEQVGQFTISMSLVEGFHIQSHLDGYLTILGVFDFPAYFTEHSRSSSSRLVDCTS